MKRDSRHVKRDLDNESESSFKLTLNNKYYKSTHSQKNTLQKKLEFNSYSLVIGLLITHDSKTSYVCTHIASYMPSSYVDIHR